METGMSFRDVRRHRDGGPTHLARQAIPLLNRKRFGDLIASHRQIDGFLPNQQLLVVLHGTILEELLDRSRHAPLLSHLSARPSPLFSRPSPPAASVACLVPFI